MTKDNVIQFKDALAHARMCDVTPADILNERDLYLAYLAWNNPDMEMESEIKLIKHERAIEQFSRKAA